MEVTFNKNNKTSQEDEILFFTKSEIRENKQQIHTYRVVLKCFYNEKIL